MDNQTIKNIHDRFPWASEETLLAGLQAAGERRKQMTDMLKHHLDLDLDDLLESLDDDQDALEKFDRAMRSADASIRKTTNEFTGALARTNDPMSGAAAMLELAASGISGTANALSGVAGLVPGVGKALGAVVSGTGAIAVGAAGVTVAFMKIFSDQEKLLRGMIDFGYVASDLDIYTAMEDMVSNVGMTLEDFTSSTAELAGMFSADSRGMNMAGMDMAIFLNESYDMIKSGEMSSYGLNVTQISEQLISETKMLFQLGEIDKLDNAAKAKIIENFQSGQEMSAYLSKSMATQRSALLRAREEIVSNIGFRTAMSYSAKELEGLFGDNYENILAQRFAIVNTLNTTVFGEGAFSDGIKQTLINFAANFKFDQNIMNDIDSATREILTVMGVMPEFEKLGNALGDPLSTPEQVLKAQIALQKAIANANQDGSIRAFTQEMRTLEANSKQFADQYDSLENSSFSTSTDILKAIVEGNKASLLVVDDAKIAFAKVSASLKPNFDTMTAVVGSVSDTLEYSQKVMAKIFGIEDKTVNEMSEEGIAEARSKVNQNLNETGIGESTQSMGNNQNLFLENLLKYSDQYGVNGGLAMGIANFESEGFRKSNIQDEDNPGAFKLSESELTKINQKYGTNFKTQDMTDIAKNTQAGILNIALQKDLLGNSATPYRIAAKSMEMSGTSIQDKSYIQGVIAKQQLYGRTFVNYREQMSKLKDLEQQEEVLQNSIVSMQKLFQQDNNRTLEHGK